MPARIAQSESSEISYEVKFLLVVLLLFLFYPVGLVLMWAWTKWPTWVKVLISLPVLVVIFMVFMGTLFFVRFWHSGFNDMPMRGNYYYYYQRGNRMMYPMLPYSPTGQVTPTPNASPTPIQTQTY